MLVAQQKAMKSGKISLEDKALTSLELFQYVYRNENFPLNVRLAAAGKALPYEFPTLGSINIKTENNTNVNVTMTFDDGLEKKEEEPDVIDVTPS